VNNQSGGKKGLGHLRTTPTKVSTRSQRSHQQKAKVAKNKRNAHAQENASSKPNGPKSDDGPWVQVKWPTRTQGTDPSAAAPHKKHTDTKRWPTTALSYYKWTSRSFLILNGLLPPPAS
jgi:hypothetical protein